MAMGNSITLKRLRTAVWLYLILLIFEGALRKWVVPSLSNPLLIVRDPIAIYILLVSRMKGILRFNPYNFWMILIGCFGIITALLQGHGNLMVAVYGARIFIIHFPLMFAIAEIFTIQHVIRYGKVLLWISLPMTALIIAQFFSPQAAFVNRGVGGDLSGAGFSGALGYYRPPGTFSFTTGTSLFYGLVAAYVFYFWFNSFLINRSLLIIATVCLLLAVPFSISRTLLFEVFLSTAFMIVSVWYRPNYLKRIAIGIIIFLAAFYLIENQGFFSTGTEVFTARFTSANESEGGLNSVFMDRFLGGMIYAVENAPNMPFFGYGLGKHYIVTTLLIIKPAFYKQHLYDIKRELTENTASHMETLYFKILRPLRQSNRIQLGFPFLINTIGIGVHSNSNYASLKKRIEAIGLFILRRILPAS